MPSASNKEIIKGLARNEVFSQASQKSLARLAEMSRAASLEPGAEIFAEGDAAGHLYLVLEGAVRLFKVNADGKEQVIHSLKAGELFGGAVLFTKQGVYPATACATSKSRVLAIPKGGLLELLKKDPDLSLRLLSFISGNIERTMKLLHAVALEPVSLRLAHFLARLARDQGVLKDGGVISLAISQAELAARLGTVREVVWRALKKLRQDGILEAKGKKVKIMDAERLEE